MIGTFYITNIGRLASCVLLVAAVLSADSSRLLAAAPETELLWPAGAPDAKGTADADKPTLIIYVADKDKATGAAVVICPGGGYGGLAMGHEGHDIAKWFNSIGVAGIIVDYRHRGKGYGHPAPLQDVQRALRTVRSRSAELGVDPTRIGVMGFSAGGHLASTAATHFDGGEKNATDPVEQAGCRPDFAILCYPVVAFDEPYTHKGSQRNLLGNDAPAELVKSLSNEKQVTSTTPPTFLFHTNEDRGVPAENSVHFYLALRRAGVPAELHVYAKGRHGLGLALKTPGTASWSGRLREWMQGRGLLAAAEKK